MAEKIGGITIKIGGDTTGLNKALSEVNKESSSTQKQLQNVNRLLKLDPKNTELLRQKQKLLNTELQTTAKKLQALKQAQAAMDSNGVDKNSEQYMALTREIIATESAKKSLTAQEKETNKALLQQTSALGKVGSAMTTVASKTKKVSAAAAAALAGIVKFATDAARSADDLNTMAQQSGFSTTELQKFNYAADLIDVDTSTIIASFRKLKKNLTSTSKETQAAFERIGVSIYDTAGEMKDGTDLFYEVVEGLSQVENETERDTLAMQLFGKSADEMAGIVDDGGEKLKQLGDEAERLGLILSEETVGSLNEVNDQLDTLKAQATAELSKAAAAALEALQPVIEKVVGWLKKLFEFIGSADPEKITIVVVILAIAAAIYPLCSALGALSAMLTMIEAHPIVALILLIIGLVVLLVATIIKNWDKIKKWWASARDSAKEQMDNFMKWIEDTFKKVVNFCVNLLNKGIDAINTFTGGLNKAIAAVGSLFGQEWTGIPAIPHIPAYAKGGLISSGSAIVGENGAEILSMTPQGAQITPLNATVDAESLAGAMAGTATNVNIVFNGDLAGLARILTPQITTENARVGRSLIH